ncbi:hypothetical protein O181_055364 [Austropuccinia psidii MF-1]|uniref:Uncharacterized protein n=1 Tax=Austropuccinia psidii MF-1 TaxID=1389203 RepID=A0A9Q3HUJ3_9BASI|nr:hypothetical protein [Austropuccinia psidii MF-1]
MRLPPLSFHASLEEKLDEEEEPEEIEAVLKVVPPVYHKYLDLLSKVKAEKLPPHCTCDHHIELEGSLPPVGVIYSLSENESETLQAYISENVKKLFISKSTFSTGEPVSFVKKKDGCLYQIPSSDSTPWLIELPPKLHATDGITQAALMGLNESQQESTRDPQGEEPL